MTTLLKEEPQALVDRLLRVAVDQGASDVYFLPCASCVNVRYRTNGTQKDVCNLDPECGEQSITRVKVLAGLLTYRTNIAQDGVIRNGPENTNAEIRVSVMPTSHGERIALRILQNRQGPPLLDELDFSEDVVNSLKNMLQRSAGMIVLTGPTGSGKTTTIYALIRELLDKKQDPASIITLEDPIECELDGVSQTAVSVDSGWNYAAALRAALRQDVKILVVGEMRDREVVKVTLDAALTGHLVITTYHAGDIPSVYARMLHQGFEPFLVASAITGVVAQRLVPRANGEGRLPAAAILDPDDTWRDFITTHPGLTELRKKIKDYPDADLPAVAQRLADTGRISTEQKLLLDLE